MEKVYLVLEENYNMLANENGASYIYGYFKDREKAIEKALNEIKTNKSYNWVIDEEQELATEDDIREHLNKGLSVVMFYEYQENWDYHYVISIKELKEVK